MSVCVVGVRMAEHLTLHRYIWSSSGLFGFVPFFLVATCLLNHVVYKNKNKNKGYRMNLLVVSSLQLYFLITKQFASKLQVQNLSHKVCLPFS
jgi:hypothetical protein